MSIPNNFTISVKEEMSGTSFMQNEGKLTVRTEPVFTFDPVQGKKNNKSSESNTDPKHDLYGEIKQDCVFHECVKDEICFQSYEINLKESQEDPLATNYSDIENAMKEYPCIGHIKEEITTEIQEEHENIDVVECKVESPFVNDNMLTNIYEENIPGSDSDGRDTASVTVQRIHKQIINHQCNECYKMFSSTHNLRFHIDSVHNGHNKYECNDCGKVFSTKKYLKMHVHRVHKGRGSVQKESKKYDCIECLKIFSRFNDLKRHISGVHRKLKNFICNDCHKMYTSKQNLKMHIESVHRSMDSAQKESKKHKCNECLRCFLRKSDLKKHIFTVHRKIRNRMCNRCGKLFTCFSSLRKHIERMHRCIDSVHKESKNYECNE